MLRTLIIEDEVNAQEALQKLIENHCDNVKIISLANTVKSGINDIKVHNPDLVLLDIKLSDGSGFDILKQIDSSNIHVIFTTAYNEFAIKAFKFSAIDYLLKPIDIDEFKDAIDKVVIAQDQKNTQKKLDVFLENINNMSKEVKKIVLKTNDSIHLVNVNDILRCESDGNYTYFYFTNQAPVLVSKNLKEYYEMLKDYQFFRPHQSHIVNINYIKKYHKLDGGYLILQDKSTIPVATRKRDELMKIFETF